MKRTLLPRIAIAAALCAATATPAGIREKAYEIGFYGGIENGGNRANVHSNSSYGLKLGYFFSRKLMFEVTVDSYDTTRDFEGRAGDPTIPANQIPFTHNAATRFTSYTAGLTANFLTDREVKTTPFLSVGVGGVTEARKGAQFCVDLQPETDPQNPNPLNATCADVRPNGSLKDPNSKVDPTGIEWFTFVNAKDAAPVIYLAVGARTFLTPWLGVMYEGRWYHHDTFGFNQDVFQLTAGASFVLGGKK
jgi:hypothetical protein